MMSEKEQKAMALTALAANFGKEFPMCLLPIWLDLLKDYSAAQVRAGVKMVIQEYEYKTIPPFAVLQKALDKASGQVAETVLIELQAESEWGKLLANIERCGSYRRPDLCATTAFVLRSMGGWEAACAWDRQKLEWRHKEFIELWQQAHGRADILALGADGVLALESGPVRAGKVLDALFEGMEEAETAQEAFQE